jgi:hypothetical protein
LAVVDKTLGKIELLKEFYCDEFSAPHSTKQVRCPVVDHAEIDRSELGRLSRSASARSADDRVAGENNVEGGRLKLPLDLALAGGRAVLDQGVEVVAPMSSNPTARSPSRISEPAVNATRIAHPGVQQLISVKCCRVSGSSRRDRHPELKGRRKNRHACRRGSTASVSRPGSMGTTPAPPLMIRRPDASAPVRAFTQSCSLIIEVLTK